MKGTVKSREDMERLFQTGRRSSSYLMTVLVMPSSDGDSAKRWGFIAGKKLGVAPIRSRCKRVLRAAAFELGGPWDGFDVAFVARRKVAYAQHDKVVAQMRKQLEQVGVL